MYTTNLEMPSGTGTSRKEVVHARLPARTRAVPEKLFDTGPPLIINA